jgi:hypothetical protein
MTGLIELKEKLKNFYADYEIFMRPIIKFLAVFISMLLIKSNIGYMSALNMWPVIVIISLLLAFVPWGMIVLCLAAIIVGNIFSLSIELGFLMFAVMLIMFLFFFRFTPRQGALLVLIPMAFFLKIPYAVPIAVGLICTPVSVVSVIFGTVIYYIIYVISENATAITNISGGKIGSASINSIINMISNNKEMLLTVIAFAVTTLVVYTIRRTAINNAWVIAIITGSIVELVITLVGSTILNTKSSIIWIIIGTILSILVSFVLQFFLFSVDYSRTEHTQFEDDEYYYYVKAVPKINVTAPEMNVKRINAQRRRKVQPRKK